MFIVRFIMRMLAIITGAVGIVSGVAILGLMAFELSMTIGLMFCDIWWPGLFEARYHGHLVVDHIYLVGWAIVSLLAFVFFSQFTD